MKRCLVAGYGFFAYRGRFYDANPAGEVAELLDGGVVGDCRVEGIVLPVSGRGLEELRVGMGRADVVVGLGLYTPGTPHIRVESVAVNALLVGGEPEPVVGEDPLWASTGIPVDPWGVARAAEEAWPARPSASIGLYYCNAMAYLIYRWSRRVGRPGVFLHLPWSTRLAERLDPGHPHAAPLRLLAEAVERVLLWLQRVQLESSAS